jgi:hypothetical protein
MVGRAEDREPRKPYAKPSIQRVELRLEEAVLGTGCKVDLFTPGVGEDECPLCLAEGT